MPLRRRILIATGGLVLFLAAALGAYGTHGVQGRVEERLWNAYQVAVDYQFYHGLGVLAAALLAERFPRSPWLEASGWTLLAGIAVFSGTLYATAFGADLGALAPLGGLLIMAGWLCLAVGALRAG